VEFTQGRVDKSSEEEVTIKLVERLRLKYPLPGHIIVYCEAVEQTKRYSQLFDCPAFYRRVGNSAVKSRILR
jgi:hypothetical protein